MKGNNKKLSEREVRFT